MGLGEEIEMLEVMFGNGRGFDGPSIPFEVVGYYRTPNNYDVIEQYSSYSSHSFW